MKRIYLSPYTLLSLSIGGALLGLVNGCFNSWEPKSPSAPPLITSKRSNTNTEIVSTLECVKRIGIVLIIYYSASFGYVYHFKRILKVNGIT